MRTSSGTAIWKPQKLGAIALSILCLLAILAPLAQATPTIGVSQSYRNFGLQAPGAYDASQDVSRSLFMSPLSISTFRVIVPWDLAGRPTTDGRRQEFQHWLNTVKALGAEPFVVFGPTELTTNIYSPSQSTRRIDGTSECDSVPEGSGDGAGCLVAPFAGTYRAAINQFIATWGPATTGGVRIIGAWNEPNVGEVTMVIPGSTDSAVYLPKSDDPNTPAVDAWTTNRMDVLTGSSGTSCPSGPTSSNCGPLLAANYWKEARAAMIAACPSGVSCYAVAGEFDSGPDAENYWDEYADKIASLGSARPSQISFHAHRDAEELGAHVGSGVDHDCKSGNVDWCITHEFNQWLQAKGGAWADRSAMKIWNTETGAAYANGSSPSSPDVAQDNRFNFLLTLSDNNNVARLYYFNFQGGGTNDRGLIDDGATVNTRVRPIWNTVRCRGNLNCPAWPIDSRRTAFADVTGDGKDDAIAVNSGGIVVRRSNGTSFGASESWTVGAYLGDRGNYFADVTGDGKADAIVVNASQNYLVVRRSNGTSFGSNEFWSLGAYLGDRGNYFADVTGDGKADAIVVNASQNYVVVRRSDGTSFGSNEIWSPGSAFLGDRGNYFADVTGDGKADAIVVNMTQNYVAVRSSTGTTLNAAQQWSLNAPFYGDVANYFADVTGDGKEDGLIVNYAGPVVGRASTGSGLAAPVSWTSNAFFGF